MTPRAGRLYGFVALAAFLLHSTFHVWRGSAHDLLWFCTTGSLLVAVGAIVGVVPLVAIGLSWIAFGTPMWLLDVATGGEFLPTSLGTHVVVPACAFLFLRAHGWPRGTWWRASLASVALLALARVATPARANVNLAFAVAPGWEAHFPSHATYLVMLELVALGSFVVVELAMRRLTSAPAKAPRREHTESDSPA